MATGTALTQPTAKMSWWKTLMVFSIAIIFDFLKFIFSIFLIAAPFIAGYLAKEYADAHRVPEWISNLIGLVVGGGPATLEILFPPIAAAFAAFGAMMAIVMGFSGWLLLCVVFFVFGVNVFAPKHLLKTLLGLGASIIPFVNMFPMLTFKTWGHVRAARHEDKEALKKWEADSATRAAEEESDIARQRATFMQIRAMQQRQALALAEAQEREAANDNEEIPEELARAA